MNSGNLVATQDGQLANSWRWLAHSENRLFISVQHYPFSSVCGHSIMVPREIPCVSVRNLGSCWIFFQWCLCISWGSLSHQANVCCLANWSPWIRFHMYNTRLSTDKSFSFTKALPLSSLTKPFTDIQGDYEHEWMMFGRVTLTSANAKGSC